MPKIAPINWRTLEKVFQADHWQHKRTKGSHRSYTKPGFIRPVVIPMYSEVGVDIIMSNMRTARMSRERYFDLLGKI